MVQYVEEVGPRRLIIGNLDRGYNSRSLSAQRRDARPNICIVRRLLFTFPSLGRPVRGEEEDEPNRHAQNNNGDEPASDLLSNGCHAKFSAWYR